MGSGFELVASGWHAKKDPLNDAQPFTPDHGLFSSIFILFHFSMAILLSIKFHEAECTYVNDVPDVTTC